jgi:CheY-like chemotaxis protein
MDFTALQKLARDRFGAEVTQVNDGPAALKALRESSYDLVTVNRILDRDGSSGLEVIRALTSAPESRHVPVLMITNFAEHQQQAVAVGAEPGFGKAALLAPETSELLRRYLE